MNRVLNIILQLSIISACFAVTCAGFGVLIVASDVHKLLGLVALAELLR